MLRAWPQVRGTLRARCLLFKTRARALCRKNGVRHSYMVYQRPRTDDRTHTSQTVKLTTGGVAVTDAWRCVRGTAGRHSWKKLCLRVLFMSLQVAPRRPAHRGLVRNALNGELRRARRGDTMHRRASAFGRFWRTRYDAAGGGIPRTRSAVASAAFVFSSCCGLQHGACTRVVRAPGAGRR